ncbi:hypothetical protein BN7_3854 [Wickerhamomyces ciferrii]|uniref:Uncharacterized protein n=1 Tax=Wickerhamomyces ciferrii (strain ATCC 14091 / BCRC 22168 / CBS 111 / JCM 3599 / NBRC 0793 / NRRL Y-1031 F-60-10) TaxID=1206466 RepID=K0KQ64_WICCF|nr:uncharacterized protein BN7_3854 [Wickerhamomyces ciferrii]CCH44292.1 hypothetical protein BN7_3854 [Wickerhamomyces ciferrii]
MNVKFPVKLAMKERRSISSSSQQSFTNLRTPHNIQNQYEYENAVIDEEEDPLNDIDSPNLIATSVENNSLLSSNSTISLLSLNNKPVLSRNTSFSQPGLSSINSNSNTSSIFNNPIMFQRVNLRRISNAQHERNTSINSIPPLNIDTLPETPNLDPVSIQNSPSNFWLNKPNLYRHGSINNQMNIDSPFLYPVKGHDGNVTPLILSPKKE